MGWLILVGILAFNAGFLVGWVMRVRVYELIAGGTAFPPGDY